MTLEFTLGIEGARRQIALLKAMPASTVLFKFARGGTPDAAGMVGSNQDAWKGAQYQRTCMHDIHYALVLDDLARAQDAWRAVTAVYDRQVLSGARAGGFASLTDALTPSADKDDVSDVAFWFSWSLQAILTLSTSSMWPTFEPVVQALLPNIRLAADYLLRQRSLLVPRDDRTPNRQFITANAFLLAGIVLHDGALIDMGKSFCDRALTSQDPVGGWFAEAGGYDSSYNAVSMWQLQVFNLYAHAQRRADALDAAAAWQQTRINPDGHVVSTGNTRTAGQETYQGSIKTIDYQSVLLGLMYYGYQRDDATVKAIVPNVYTYWTTPQ